MESNSNKFSVLIVDDCIQICNIMGDLLQSHGYIVHYAYNGKEAVEQARAVIPHVILMDFHMPVMNGLEAVREIKKIESTKDIPVIMVTSCLEKENDAIAMGCFSYELKPMSSSTIINRVKDALTKCSNAF